MGFPALSKLIKLLHARSVTLLLFHLGLGPALAELKFFLFFFLNVHYLQGMPIYNTFVHSLSVTGHNW